MSHSFFDTPIEYLKGVGPSKAALLQKEAGVATYGDLLSYFPHRYLDASRINNIAELSEFMDYVQLRGRLSHIRMQRTGHRPRLTAQLSDATGTIELIWFQGASYVEQQLIAGKVYNVFGKISYFNHRFSIPHPDLELVVDADQLGRQAFVPLYPSTAKLSQRGLSNRGFGKVTKPLLALYAQSNERHQDAFPAELLQQHALCSYCDAILNIHFPASDEWREAAERRLKFQELFIAQLKIAKLKVQQAKLAGWHFEHVGAAFHGFYSQHLPFQLTAAQQRVLKEIRQDTLSGHQMNRLLQGDVGSGKTIVALLSILIAIDNGFQACVMAPTEILAQQHYQGMAELLQDTGITIALLTGSVKAKDRKPILGLLASGDLKIIIGTHALVEDKVVFSNLGLAVIDEQHRFGVAQRSKLWAKNTLPPHILVMTATPIPRTLAMTLYGDLDVSVIDELPPGRKPILTLHRSDRYRGEVMQHVASEIALGRQVYIVYPLIEESEKLDYESLMAGYEQVKAWFPDPKYNVAMVHGKQEPAMKKLNMHKFASGEAHILVSTTVIEVGVNVPNASVMVIESAERFGLSQLHQLRGRVGRGAEKSYCILLTGQKLSKESRQRMEIMVRTQNGFEISEEDLRMRGPGDIYGTRQSGALDFKLADIVNDVSLIAETKEAAERMIAKDPELSLPQHQGLAALLTHTRKAKTGVKWDRIS